MSRRSDGPVHGDYHVGFPGGDLFYGGDMGQWRRFANSLRLRLAIRI